MVSSSSWCLWSPRRQKLVLCDWRWQRERGEERGERREERGERREERGERREERGERREERGVEVKKMREAREKEQMMKIVCLKNTKKTPWHREKCLFPLKIQKYNVFQ